MWLSALFPCSSINNQVMAPRLSVCVKLRTCPTFIYCNDKHLKKKVDTVNDQAEDEAAEEDLTRYKLGIVPPKTHDREKMTTEGDNLNFAALCRGVELLPANVTKDLKCYLTTKDDPYYKLHPLQVLIISYF